MWKHCIWNDRGVHNHWIFATSFYKQDPPPLKFKVIMCYATQWLSWCEILIRTTFKLLENVCIFWEVQQDQLIRRELQNTRSHKSNENGHSDLRTIHFYVIHKILIHQHIQQRQSPWPTCESFRMTLQWQPWRRGGRVPWRPSRGRSRSRSPCPPGWSFGRPRSSTPDEWILWTLN